MLVAGREYYVLPLAERPFSPLDALFAPTGLIGQGLGIVGTLMIALGVVSYGARKRVRALARFGKLKDWLHFHIFLCLLGPFLVVLHTTFKFGGLVAIAFWSMVLVVDERRLRPLGLRVDPEDQQRPLPRPRADPRAAAGSLPRAREPARHDDGGGAHAARPRRPPPTCRRRRRAGSARGHAAFGARQAAAAPAQARDLGGDRRGAALRARARDGPAALSAHPLPGRRPRARALADPAGIWRRSGASSSSCG